MHTANHRDKITISKAPHIRHGEHLFEMGMFSDCTIHCQDETWKLHRAMLVPRCDFFRACFTLGFQESVPRAEGCEKLQDGVSVDMHDDDAEALGRMLRWIYTFSYPALAESRSPLTSPSGASGDTCDVGPEGFWTSELNLCITSDKYGLIPLCLDAAFSILDTARDCMSDPDLPQHCETFTTHLDNFVDMLEILYFNISIPSLPCHLQTGLLEIMGDMIAKHIGHETRLSELMTTVPLFGVMLVQVLGGSSSNSDTSDEGRDVTPYVSDATKFISARHRPVSRKQRRGSAESESSSSNPEDWYLTDRHQRTKIRGRKQHTPTVARVHIPMNEDSDLE